MPSFPQSTSSHPGKAQVSAENIGVSDKTAEQRDFFDQHKERDFCLNGGHQKFLQHIFGQILLFKMRQFKELTAK